MLNSHARRFAASEACEWAHKLLSSGWLSEPPEYALNMQTNSNNIPNTMNGMYMNMGVGSQGVQPQALGGGMQGYSTGMPAMGMGMGMGAGMPGHSASYYNIIPEEQPIFVNAKQYNRILKRRESRKKQLGNEAVNVAAKRRPYLHESRHKHAMNRKRGVGGRFLSKAEKESEKHAQTGEDADVDKQ